MTTRGAWEHARQQQRHSSKKCFADERATMLAKHRIKTHCCGTPRASGMRKRQEYEQFHDDEEDENEGASHPDTHQHVKTKPEI